MRIVFIGSKDLGCRCLEELISRKEDLVGVIARKDDPYPGMWYGSVSQIAERHGLQLLRPKDINDPDFAKKVMSLKPDIIFVVFYPQILKKHFIEIPPRGCVNLHFAPLPKYRGCMPGGWAIINGEDEFGVTMHYIDEGVDSGDIIAQEFLKISDDETGYTLYKKCEEAGLELFKRTFPLIKEGRAPRTRQDKSKVIYHKRGIPNDRYVDWDKPARSVYNYIRALTFPAFPPPRTTVNGSEIGMVSSKVLGERFDAEPGEVVKILAGNKAVIATADFGIMIEIDGKVALKKGDKLGERTIDTVSRS